MDEYDRLAAALRLCSQAGVLPDTDLTVAEMVHPHGVAMVVETIEGQLGAAMAQARNLLAHAVALEELREMSVG